MLHNQNQQLGAVESNEKWLELMKLITKHILYALQRQEKKIHLNKFVENFGCLKIFSTHRSSKQAFNEVW